MNIFVLTNDYVISILILGIIIYGTKLINYYYNFYHIYNYLDYEQKLGYFKYNCLIELISKYPSVKKIGNQGIIGIGGIKSGENPHN